MAIIKGICVFLSVASNYRCIRVFKLLLYLGIKGYSAILSKKLYYCNLLLLKGSFCLTAIAFYKVSMEFLFRLLQDF